MSAAIADMTCASGSDSSMGSNSSKACRGWIGWDGRPADVARQPGISELNRKPAGAGCLLQPGVGPARSICCLKNRHEGILRLFSQRDNRIDVFQITCVCTPNIQKNDAKRYIFVAPKKNAKTHLFGRKRQEVPCFFKEVRFQKSTPLVISREFVNPFAKTGGKASILVRPVNSRLSSLFVACFLGTDAQKTGNAVWTGLLFSPTGGRDVGRAKIEPAEQVVGKVDFTNHRQTQRALFAGYANTLVVRKTVAERYKRPYAQKNVKNIPFEGKPQKVPCFCEGDTFLKISPSTISREFFIPFAKTGVKASILACRRAALPSQRASAGLGDLSVGGKRRGAEGAESALPGSCVRVSGLVAGAGERCGDFGGRRHPLRSHPGCVLETCHGTRRTDGRAADCNCEVRSTRRAETGRGRRWLLSGRTLFQTWPLADFPGAERG
jgi:hypothetical protein